MLGILLAGLPGCGQSPNNKETSSSESSAADEPESEIIYINGVLTESDEDSVTMEYGSEGNFTQTTFDISNADISEDVDGNVALTFLFPGCGMGE